MDIPQIWAPPDNVILTSYAAIARLSPVALVEGFGDGDGTWGSFGANVAVYIPFGLTAPARITKLMVYNGTSVAGNVDVGVYDVNGTRIVSSGSTAQSGTSTWQMFDVTDTDIGRGIFYMALTMSSASAHSFNGSYQTRFLQAAGCMQQSSALPLPATATFASWTFATLPTFGLMFSPRTTNP